VIAHAELAAWLRLLGTPQVGRDSARRLLAAFGSPQAVFDASAAARHEVAGASAAALAAPAEGFEALVESTLAWLAAGAQRSIVTLGDAGYPELLLHTADPPLLLYLEGRAELLQAASLAIVGSRNATHQGSANARAFAHELSAAGLTIVSGLALGIDGAAHAGGLEAAGSTIAVVGTGLDQAYPRRHRELARRIAVDGLMVSEYPLGMPPLAGNFPVRNRIIAGLSQGTLVVEAALQSGSLGTARCASEAGREVFAIPGSIHSPQSRGCHWLIKQGAKLVERADEILEELRLPLVRTAAPAGTTESGTAGPGRHAALLAALGFDPVLLDELVARTGRPAAELHAELLELELEGLVARLPGQLFQRIARV
jgi:DNA processing protein